MLVEAKGIGVHRSGRWLLKDVDIAVGRGEIVTLVGPNGAGKSTLVKALLGLLKIDHGEVRRTPSIKIGYVPQHLSIDHSMPLTVGRLMTLTGRYADEEIASALQKVGIEGHEGSPVQRLSGGEFRRALLARAILNQPDLLVLDEPVQGVDFTGEIALYELIADVAKGLGCGVLLISHDLHIVMAKTDRVVCLNAHICCQGSPQTVTRSPAYHALFGPRASEAIAVYQHHHDDDRKSMPEASTAGNTGPHCDGISHVG